MKKIEIIPAILETSFSDIKRLVSEVSTSVKTIQIDICDGFYTSDNSWPFKKGVSEHFADDFEMPGWDTFDYELDLMIRNPELQIDNLKNLGASRAVIHIASASLESLKKATTLLDSYQIQIGLGLQNGYDKEKLTEMVEFIETLGAEYYFQVMGIDSIGRQHQPFQEKVLVDVKDLSIRYPSIDIQVDGSVNKETCNKLIEAGANRLVIGSALFDTNKSFASSLEEIKNLIYLNQDVT